jgi:hypothetical protein
MEVRTDLHGTALQDSCRVQGSARLRVQASGFSRLSEATDHATAAAAGATLIMVTFLYMSHHLTESGRQCASQG